MPIEGLDDFLKELEKQGAPNIRQTVRNMQRRVTLDIHSRLIMTNPVDTGTSRASWFITQDEPSEEKPIKADYSLSDARENRKASKYIKAYSQTWITNNQEYIEDLNEGRSDQADPGFVEAAVRLAEMALEDAIKAGREDEEVPE